MYNKNTNVLSAIIQSPISPRSTNVLWDDMVSNTLKVYRKGIWTVIGGAGGGGGEGSSLYWGYDAVTDVLFPLERKKVQINNTLTVNGDIRARKLSVEELTINGEDFTQYWELDPSTNTLYTNYQVKIGNNLIVEGDTSSGGSGQDTPSAGGSLSNLSDVSLGSLSEGDVLVYDKGNGVWYNVPQSKIVPNLEGYAKESWVQSNFLESDALETYKEELHQEVKTISDLLVSMWRIEGDNLVTDKQVLIKNNLIVEQDTSSGGEGQDTPAEGTVTGIEVNGTPYEPNTQGVIDLSDAFNAIDVSEQLKDYYTQTQTDSAISAAIANLINGAPTTLDTLKEIADALAENEDVVDALEEAIGKKADNTTVTALAERVSANEGAIDDNAGNIKKNSDAIDALDKRVTDEEAVTTTYKTWWADLKKYIKVEGDNVKIDTNLIVSGDTSSGGSGQDTPASGTVTGIKVSASETLTPNNAGIIDMVSVLSSIDVSDQLKDYAKLTDITKSRIDSVLGSTTAGNANRFLMSTGSTSVWAAITKTMVTDALGYTPLSTGGGTINSGTFAPLKIAGTSIRASVGFSKDSSAYAYLTYNGGSNWAVTNEYYNNEYTLYHTGNFNPANYLPLSGGTLQGDSADLLVINRLSSTSTAYITFKGNNSLRGRIGFDANNNPIVQDVNYGTGNHTLIHSGNIGSQLVKGLAKSVTIWGQSFDGTGNVSGNILGGTKLFAIYGYDDNGNTNIIDCSGINKQLWIGYGSAAKSYNTELAGNNIYFHHGTSCSIGMVLNTSGNVLIGTTTDYGDKLQVDGTIKASGSLISTTGRISLQPANKIYGDIVMSDLRLDIQAIHDGVSYLPITMNASGGNVLIGTTTDSGYKLDVAGTGSFYGVRYEPRTFVPSTTGWYRVYKSLIYSRGDNVRLNISSNYNNYPSGSYTFDITVGYQKANITQVGSAIHSSNKYLSNVRVIFDGNYAYIDVYISGNSNSWYVSGSGRGEFQSGVINTETANVFATLSPVDNSMVVGGNLIVSGAVTMSSTLSVAGQTTINNNLVVSGDTSSGSDIRFKDIIKNKTIKIEHIAKAPLFTFKWNDREDDTIHLGSSAQYWERITPWLVSGEDFKSLNYAGLGVAMGISLAKKAVNHEERIKVLERKVKSLEEENRRLRYGN